jgi:hypothetical protein
MGVAYIDINYDYGGGADTGDLPLKMVAYDEDGEVVDSRGQIVVTPKTGDMVRTGGRVFKPTDLGHPDLIKIAKEMGLGQLDVGWGPFNSKTRTPYMSWRNSSKIATHPAAEMFPLLPRDELEALAKDIKENYLREQVTVITEGGKQLVIDGRNRLDAIELAGFNVVDPQTDRLLKSVCGDWPKGKDRDPATVEAFIVSKNIHRRHLSIEDRRRIAAERLKADPARSDRAIAKEVRLSPTTIGAIREKIEETSTVQTGQLETEPAKRVGRDGKARKQPDRKKSAAISETNPNIKQGEIRIGAGTNHVAAARAKCSAEVIEWIDRYNGWDRKLQRQARGVFFVTIH